MFVGLEVSAKNQINCLLQGQYRLRGSRMRQSYGALQLFLFCLFHGSVVHYVYGGGLDPPPELAISHHLIVRLMVWAAGPKTKTELSPPFVLCDRGWEPSGTSRTDANAREGKQRGTACV